MLTQGNCLNNCDVGDGDSIFYWKEAANGTWTKPTTASGAMPAFKATLSESPQIADPCPTTNQLTSYQGAFGGPEIVKDTAHTGSKLYMAYLQPVGDWWAGEIGWAVSSDDGLTWTKQTQPLIYALAHRGHQSSGSCPEGFSALGLTTTTDGTGTWFHVYGSYFHPSREYPPGYVSYVDYRIQYDASNSFGLGTTRQILKTSTGQWVNSTGQLVWSYDAISPQPGDEKLDPSAIRASWGDSTYFFAGPVTKANNVYYMTVDKWRTVGDPLYLKTSCDGINWNPTALTIDTSKTIQPAQYPGKVLVNNNVYYGTRFNTKSGLTETGFWGFVSLGSFCGSGAYDGTRILPTKINITTVRTCP